MCWPVATTRRQSEVNCQPRERNEDDVVSVENAAVIAEHLPNGELIELPAEDRSSRDDEPQIIEATSSFLR